MKSMYQYVKEVWKNPKKSLGKLAWRNRLAVWRKEPAVNRIERPTRIDRARSLGYRAKQGYVVVRTRIKKGVTKRPKIKGAKRPKRHAQMKLPVIKSKQRIAEERVSKQFPNLEVLNSYWVGDDSKQEWFEVILVDPSHPVIKADRKIGWIQEPQHKGRAHRGKTSAGQKGRGLRK